MFLATDAVVVGLRALTFVALFQATGTAIFSFLFGGGLSGPSATRVRKLARVSALIGLALNVSYYVLTPARFAGSFGGAFDPGLQRLLLDSSAGFANIVRIVGLATLAASLGTGGRGSRVFAAAGIGLALASFVLMGHTSIHAWRWLLAPLLLVHLVVAAAWFGALVPLCWIAREEPVETSGALISRFSALAARTVPAIFVCGLVMAAVLLGGFAQLLTPYGAMIIVKTVGFAVLMALAVVNKWRYGPAIAARAEGAVRRFVRTVAAEAVLIVAILMTTAVMTSLFAPARLHEPSSQQHSDHR